MAHSRAVRAEAAGLLAASTLTHGQIAERVGISRRQLQRWLHEDPEFQGMVEGFAVMAEDTVRARLRGYGVEAVEALAEVAREGEGQHGTGRAGAATALLRFILGDRQRIEHAGSIASDDAGRLDSIEAERAALLAELSGEE
jgi:transposase-like protein